VTDADRPPLARLPGVGLRLDLADVDGRAVHVVRRHDGSVEIHAGQAGPVRLDPDAAHSLAAFASGRYVMDQQIGAKLADALGGLRFDWVRIAPGWHAAGHTIEELAVRRTTGVTVVAVLRGSLPIVDPDPDLRLVPGDELVVACRQDALDGLERFLREGP